MSMSHFRPGHVPVSPAQSPLKRSKVGHAGERGAVGADERDAA
ncbi:hypothetical protein QE381_003414 [Microbacterium sp. SORGH_AS 888]|nr:hypothetical protein [Microbacterium sp. SORGH_AS_0888]